MVSVETSFLLAGMLVAVVLIAGIVMYPPLESPDSLTAESKHVRDLAGAAGNGADHRS